uniref:LRRCT domain-containing protein n=1 Tax=Branchiostoma floridae TaxID=7739 RepID=C3YBR6_BRAFL|eukprot:XP_002606413.1 hypothetical protein BRAFLDRAFT_67664 [Branchiostoma floridae]
MVVVSVVILTLTTLLHNSEALTASQLVSRGCTVRNWYKKDVFLLPVVAIRCDNKGLTSVPKELPFTLAELHLPNNAITTFSCTYLPQLNYIVLRNNSIRYFPWYCLRNMPRLVNLDLSHNLLFCVNLYPVKSFLSKLNYVDVSYNDIKTLSMCDLGWDGNGTNGRYASYKTAITGNPFHCDCNIAWVTDLAVKAEMCQNAMTPECVQFLKRNDIARVMFYNQSLFRCKTPTIVENVKLHRLNDYISECFAVWDPTGENSRVYMPEPCDPNRSCPKEHQDLSPSEKPKPLQTKIHLISQKMEDTLRLEETHNKSTPYSIAMVSLGVPTPKERQDVSPSVKDPFRLFKADIVATENISKITTVSETPETYDKSTPHSVAMASLGVPTLVVGVTSIVCVLMLAVYSAMFRKHSDDTYDMALGLAVNNIVDQNAPDGISDNIDRVDDQSSCNDSNAEAETQPDRIEPYAESFGYDVPQYGLGNVEVCGGTGCKKIEHISTGPDTQASEHVYHNAEVSEQEGTQETQPDRIKPYAESFGHDMPQYGLGDVEVCVETSCKKTEHISTGPDTQASEHVYHNAEVSEEEGMQESQLDRQN